MLGIEPRVSHMLSTSSTTGLHPSPQKGILKAGRWGRQRCSQPRDGGQSGPKKVQVGGQTRCQERRDLAREEGPIAQSTQSFSYIPCPV